MAPFLAFRFNQGCKVLLDDAKEAGQEVSQKEYDAITKPKTELTFMAHGVIIKADE